jgi:flavin-binding protein dodecin
MSSVAQITEISSISEKSFEDAIQQGIAQATQSLQGVKGAWVKEQEVQIENGRVSGYKVNLMITFGLGTQQAASQNG